MKQLEMGVGLIVVFLYTETDYVMSGIEIGLTHNIDRPNGCFHLCRVVATLIDTVRNIISVVYSITSQFVWIYGGSRWVGSPDWHLNGGPIIWNPPQIPPMFVHVCIETDRKNVCGGGEESS
jgi:hypothetical protein